MSQKFGPKLPMWVKSSLSEKEMLVGYSDGTVNRTNLITHAVDKEVVLKFSVDPHCADCDRDLTWIVSRSSKKARRKTLHYLMSFQKGVNRFIKPKKGRKAPPADPQKYYFWNNVQMPSRVKFARVITEGDRVVVYLASNAMLMANLNHKDFDPSSLVIRNRGSVHCMELSLNQKFVYLGLSLRMVEVIRVKNMKLKSKCRVIVGMVPTCLNLSLENNMLAVGTFRDDVNKVFNLKDFKVDQGETLELSHLVGDLVVKEEEAEVQEDEFDDEGVLRMKNNFMKKQQIMVLEKVKEVNRELLEIGNRQGDRFVESRIVAKTTGVRGLNAAGAEIYAILTRLKEILFDACRLAMSMTRSKRNLRAPNQAASFRVLKDKLEILLVGLSAKTQFWNQHVEEFCNKKNANQFNKLELTINLTNCKKVFEELMQNFENSTNTSEKFKGANIIVSNLLKMHKRAINKMRQEQRNRARRARNNQNQAQGNEQANAEEPRLEENN